MDRNEVFAGIGLILRFVAPNGQAPGPSPGLPGTGKRAGGGRGRSSAAWEPPRGLSAPL